MGSYLTAFLVGGLFCLIGQLLFDLTPFTPGIFFRGCRCRRYPRGIGPLRQVNSICRAGASLPIASFGNALAKGAMLEAARRGVIGVLTGMLS